jgi:hypothetical protein
MTFEIQVLTWDRHKYVAGLKPVNGIPTAIHILYVIRDIHKGYRYRYIFPVCFLYPLSRI